MIAVCLGLVLTIAFASSPSQTAFDNWVFDTGFELLKKTPPQNVAIIEVDSKSLHAIGAWPWSRAQHAALTERLSAERASRLVFDIDFGSPSDDPAADAELAASLRDARMPVLLPVFSRPLSSENPRLVLSQPNARFLPHVETGLVDVAADDDGLVRRLVHRKVSLSGAHRSIAAVLRDFTAVPDATYPVDFAHDLESVPRVSYVDVLQDRYPEGFFEGKLVYVGKTAQELGDQVAVPAYKKIAGVDLQLLSYLTLGKPLEHTGAGWSAALILVVIAVFLVTHARHWLLQICTYGLMSAVWVGGALVLQYQYGQQVPVAGAIVAMGCMYAVNLLATLDRQRILLIVSRLSEEKQTALIHSLFAGSVDGILLVDATLEIKHANEAAAELLRHGRPLVGLPLSSFIPRLDNESALVEAMRACSGGALVRWTARIDGADSLLDVAVSELADQAQGQFLIIIRDVTEQDRQEKELAYQAAHDSLTGLLNRRTLSAHLDEMLVSDEAALLMIDLDRFKHINDTLGHVIGDEVLRIVSKRLAEVIPHGGVVARFGGDEFCVCLPEVDAMSARAVGELILEVLRTPISVEGVGLEVGASIGIAMYPTHAETHEALLQRADIALYKAKARRTSIELADEDTSGPSVRQLQIAGSLRKAIDNSMLRMMYQPKYAVSDGRIVGVEALVRWRDPKLGDVAPDEFVGLAEETDLIHPLTDWTLRRSIEDMQGLAEQGHTVTCAVNISARHFRDLIFAARFADICKRTGVPEGSLELEITESALMNDPEKAVEVIEILRETGATLAVDDFGTGFSSLAYLRQFNLDCLKIDKCFVDDLVNNSADQAIVRSVVQLAHDLGMTVTAEGVEAQEQLALLQELGCDTIQGYFLSKPLEIHELLPVLAERDGAAEIVPFPGTGEESA